MPNALPAPLRITALLLFAFAAAQQQLPQDPLHNAYRSSPPENAALRPITLSSALTEGAVDPNPGHQRRKNTIHTSSAFSSGNERAVATLAPAIEPAVRAPPAKPAAGPTRGLSSRPRARSLQDWEVENFVLLATVDGSIYARDRNTGRELWKFYSERPMVETIYHRKRSNVADGDEKDDFMWIVEPNQDGSLYVFVPGPNAGIQKLGLTVKQLAEELSPYASEESPFVYTAEKRNTLFTLNATNGAAIKFFSAGGSGVMDQRSCRSVNGLEMEEEDECEPTPTINLGRTEYVVGIQDRDTGESICTIKYFEWTPNNRDRDLQAQYSETMDNKYIYSRFDGGIIALEHSVDKKSDDNRFLYRKKFTSSPIVRVFDVARPQGADSREIPLVVLPQPVPTVNTDISENVFVNCTEAGSWYALSEASYPSVTDGAAEAKCYQASLSDDYIFREDEHKPFKASEMVGVHSLSDFNPRAHDVPSISGPEELVPIVEAGAPAEKLNKNTTEELHIDPPASSLFSRDGVKNQLGWVMVALLCSLLIFQSHPKLPDWLRAPPKVVEQKLPVAPIPETTTVQVDHQSATEPEIERKVRFAPVEDEAQQVSQSIAGAEITTTQKEDQDSAANETSLASSSANGQPAPSETPKKRKVHRGQRGRKKRPAQDPKEGANPEDETVSRIVEGVVKLDQSMQPDENNTVEGNITDVSGSVHLNNLIVHDDKVLGYGSGGTIVYEGSFEGREVAVKRMLLQYFDLASQEVSLLQQSDDHPNVIRYYCHQRGRDFLYIAVERCQASLFDLYREGGTRDCLTEDQGRLVDEINSSIPPALYQLASGLSHLHSLRIIHRDIKPQNILIAFPKKNQKGGPRFVISDFGLCRTLPDNVSTLVGTMGNAGTVGWKAPELIGQPRDIDGRLSSNGLDNGSSNSNDGASQGVKRAVDIFSLGCVFFYVLTNGAHPFDKEDSEVWQAEREINIKKGISNFSKLRDLGDDAEEPMHLIEWMLSPRPEKR
jgi:serine/threonine-protein kinase/endoribonuclease IRE1